MRPAQWWCLKPCFNAAKVHQTAGLIPEALKVGIILPYGTRNSDDVWLHGKLNCYKLKKLINRKPKHRKFGYMLGSPSISSYYNNFFKVSLSENGMSADNQQERLEDRGEVDNRLEDPINHEPTEPENYICGTCEGVIGSGTLGDGSYHRPRKPRLTSYLPGTHLRR